MYLQKKRKYEGKVYTLFNKPFSSKAAANTQVKQLRLEGYSARVVAYKSYGEYFVYARKR